MHADTGKMKDDIKIDNPPVQEPATSQRGCAPGYHRYFMRLAYNGLPYHGWQRQPGAVTVQQCIEEALATVMRQPSVAVTGAGRTDAGVSAARMVAHFDLPENAVINAGNEAQILRALNSLLAPNIVIYRIRRMPDDVHARFDAVSRSYRYFVHTVRSPFTGGMSWLAPATLDFDAMNRAAALLLETEDFTSFSKLHTDTKTNICHVTHAAWRAQGGGGGKKSDCECEATDCECEAADCECEAADCECEVAAGKTKSTLWVFEITADRFLRNMVRAIVGTLVEVGRGKMTVDDFRRVINQRDRCAAGTSMPAGPLFLHEVKYPYPV